MFPFRRLNIGERITQFPAGSWNAIIDWIEKSSGQQQSTPPTPPPPIPPMQRPMQSGAPGGTGGGLIQIQNMTSEVVPMYGVLGVQEPLNSPQTDPSAPYRQEPFKGTTPIPTSVFAIVQPPSDLAPGYVGPAVVSGLTWAKVIYREKTHVYCHPQFGMHDTSVADLEHLESDHSGGARIVWLEHRDSDDPTNGGYPQWALIDVGAHAEPEFALGVVDESHDPIDNPDAVMIKLTRLFTTSQRNVDQVVRAFNAYGVEFKAGDKVLVHIDKRTGYEFEEGGDYSVVYFAFGAGSSAPLVEFRLIEDLGVDRFPIAELLTQLAPTGENVTVTNPLIPYWGYGPRQDSYNDDSGSLGWAIKEGSIYWIVAIEQPVLFALVRLAQDRSEAYIGESGHARFDATVLSDETDYGLGLHCKPMTRIGPDNRVHVWDNNSLAESAVAGDKWVVAFSAGQYELLCPIGGDGYAIVKGTAQHTVQRANDSVVLENLEAVQGPLPPHTTIIAAIPSDAKMDCPSGTELYAFYDVSAGEDDQTRWCAAHKHNHYWIMRGHEGFDQFSSSYERQVLTNQGGTEPEMKWADSEWGGYTADIDVVVDASWNAETCEMTLTKKRLSFTDGRLTDVINLP